MKKAILCLLLMLVYMQTKSAFASDNSCQHAIVIKFLPFNKAELKGKAVSTIQIPNALLAPIDLINERPMSISLKRMGTSGYFGKITAQLDKNYDFGFIASFDSGLDHSWKELDVDANSMLSGISNFKDIQKDISYGISFKSSVNLPDDDLITVIWTVTDDEKINSQELLPCAFYSYEQFFEIIDSENQISQPYPSIRFPESGSQCFWALDK